MNYPTCTDKLVIRVNGMGQLTDNRYIGRFEIRKGINANDTFWKDSLHLGVRFNPGRDPNIGDNIYQIPFMTVGVNDPIPNRQLAKADVGDLVYVFITIYRHSVGYLDQYIATNAIPYPGLGGQRETLNSCLALVVQEQASRADNLQATIATQELVSLRASQKRVAETELIKTKTLSAELIHAEAKTVILQDIVRIRLAGTEDRARLLNEHLELIRESSADFDLETSEVETTIQKYIDFNAALLTEINQYYENLRSKAL